MSNTQIIINFRQNNTFNRFQSLGFIWWWLVRKKQRRNRKTSDIAVDPFAKCLLFTFCTFWYFLMNNIIGMHNELVFSSLEHQLTYVICHFNEMCERLFWCIYTQFWKSIHPNFVHFTYINELNISRKLVKSFHAISKHSSYSNQHIC